MKKCKLLPILDNQEKRINQIHGLSNVLMLVGGLSNHSQNDLYTCLSIVSDLSEHLAANQESISKSVTELSIINDCVNGTVRD